MFSGGALSRFTIFALGIMPYISASIIMQLMTVVIPSLEALKKEGEAGRRKITQYTRYGTLGLALFQALGIAMALEGSQPGLVMEPGLGFPHHRRGQPDDRHDVPDVAGRADHRARPRQRHLDPDLRRHRRRLPNAIGGLFELVRTGAMSIIVRLFIIAWSAGDVRRGVRRARAAQDPRQLRQAPGRQQGLRRADSHLPLKLNMSGVIPPIFASSIILLPATLVGWFATGEGLRWLKDLSAALSPGSRSTCCCTPRDRVLLLLLHRAGVQQPRDGRQPEEERRLHSRHPPGRADRRYIDRILTRLTLAGAIYITLVCLLPEFLVLQVERAVLLRRHLAADHRGRDDGLHGRRCRAM